MSDFIKLKTNEGFNVILQRSQISSVVDLMINDPVCSKITMINGTEFVVRETAEHIFMQYIGTKQA